MAPTSASSQGSGDSTSQSSKPSDSPASDRSNGTDTAPPSSSDTGPESLAGETSQGLTLLPTPKSTNNENRQTEGQYGDNLGMALAPLLPTPTAQPYGNNQSPSPNAAVRPSLDSLISSAADSPASHSQPLDDERERTTSGISGPSSPASSLNFDPDMWVIENVPGLLSGEPVWDYAFARSSIRRLVECSRIRRRSVLATFSGTFPRWGSMRDGQVTEESGSSSLHTPTTGDTTPTYDHRASPGYTRAIPVPNLAAQVDQMLPIPRTSDANGVGTHGDGGADLRTSLGDLTEPLSNDGSE